MLADSSVWANWFVAGGTIGLALVTVYLVWQARDELRLERERIVESQTPRVFPTPSIAWSEGEPPYNEERRLWPTVLPVTNGGPGVALNVVARLEWLGDDPRVERTVPASLAPGADADLRINWGAAQPVTEWTNVNGSLIYDDMSGTHWQTDFHVITDRGRRNVSVGATICVGDV